MFSLSVRIEISHDKNYEKFKIRKQNLNKQKYNE